MCQGADGGRQSPVSSSLSDGDLEGAAVGVGDGVGDGFALVLGFGVADVGWVVVFGVASSFL